MLDGMDTVHEFSNEIFTEIPQNSLPSNAFLRLGSLGNIFER
jgi:hypothetical protein